MKKKILVTLLVVACILANAGVDQLSKRIATAELAGKGTVQVVGDVFVLTLVTNDGGFLGMGGDWPPAAKIIVLQLAPLGMLLAMAIVVLIGDKLLISERLALASIIGGGASNIVERLVSGEVVDFMNFGFGRVIRTGILNVADLSVFFGVAALLIIMVVKSRKMKKAAADVKPETPASPGE